MSFLTAYDTDIGTRKKTNQDSMLIMQANTPHGEILLAAMCDGMGGLAKGEVASAAMVRSLESWFRNSLPRLLRKGFSGQALFRQWQKLIDDAGSLISNYGRDIHVSLGTTCAALLILQGRYYVMNVGDSRIYKISDNIYQLTKDQTYVQREIDMGRMTEEEALYDPNRNVLLQCIGASDEVVPQFEEGNASLGEVFLLCCDGFRHVILPEEFYQAFYPPHMNSEELMTQRINDLIRLNIERNEDDNISAVLIKIAGSDKKKSKRTHKR